MKQDFHTDVPADQFGFATAEMVQALGYGSFAPAFEECIGLAHKSIAENFVATAAPHGGEWPSRKQKGAGKEVGQGHPLLILSGKLFQAATGDFGEGSLKEINDRGAATGVNSNAVPYAAAQNFGIKGRLPQREFEDVSDLAMDAMAELIADQGIELLL